MSEIKTACIVCDAEPGCEYWKNPHGQFALNQYNSSQRIVRELRTQLEEAREVIEFYAEAGSGTHNGLYVYTLAPKAQDFLAKYPKGEK